VWALRGGPGGKINSYGPAQRASVNFVKISKV
jgi:hypothetical protein